MFIDVGGLITSEVFIHACGEVTLVMLIYSSKVWNIFLYNYILRTF